MAKTVIGLFDERDEAQAAINDLVRDGFPRESISVAANDEAAAKSGEAPADRPNVVATDAGVGAVAGAVLGGAGGLAVGLGLLAIPGLGPLAAAGPIAAALAGAGVGAVAGGLVGALVGLGVSHEEAGEYAEGVRRGGTLVVLQTDDNRAERAAALMRDRGAVNVRERAGQWRQEGWRGYDPKAAPFTAEEAARERARYRVQQQVAASPQVAAAEQQRAAAQQAVAERQAAEASRAQAAPREFDYYEPNFRRDFETTLANRGFTYEYQQPAYKYGYYLATDPRYRGRNWDAIEAEARQYWEERNPNTWEQFEAVIRRAWEQVAGR